MLVLYHIIYIYLISMYQKLKQLEALATSKGDH